MCKWGKNINIRLIGGKLISVDSCLAPLIKMMNKFGIKTVGCCCGHGKNRGSVMIDNDREDKLMTEILLKL